MSLKDILNAVTGRNKALKPTESAPPAALPSDSFPILPRLGSRSESIRKTPAFRPCRAGRGFRHIAGSGAHHRSDGDHGRGHRRKCSLPPSIPWAQRAFCAWGEYGTSGNIVDSQNVITGRMYFKPVENMPLTQTTTTIMPFNPATMAVAVAIMRIEEKLDALQKTAEETLQFLKLDKQSKTARRPQRPLGHIRGMPPQWQRRQLPRPAQCRSAGHPPRGAAEHALLSGTGLPPPAGTERAPRFAGCARHAERRHGRVPRIPAFLLSLRLFDLSGRGAAGGASTMQRSKPRLTNSRHTASATRSSTTAAAPNWRATRRALWTSVCSAMALAMSPKPWARRSPTSPSCATARWTKLCPRPATSSSSSIKYDLSACLQALEPLHDHRMATFAENIATLDHLCNDENALLTDGTFLYLLTA